MRYTGGKGGEGGRVGRVLLFSFSSGEVKVGRALILCWAGGDALWESTILLAEVRFHVFATAK